VSAEPVRSGERARQLLVAQLTGAVRWSDGVRCMASLGAVRYVEAGPGSVLTGLLRRIDPALRGQAVGGVAALSSLTPG